MVSLRSLTTAGVSLLSLLSLSINNDVFEIMVTAGDSTIHLTLITASLPVIILTKRAGTQPEGQREVKQQCSVNV